MALAPLHVIALVWSCTSWSYIIIVSVLHALSTPKYGTERLEWSEDTLCFGTVVY